MTGQIQRRAFASSARAEGSGRHQLANTESSMPRLEALLREPKRPQGSSSRKGPPSWNCSVAPPLALVRGLLSIRNHAPRRGAGSHRRCRSRCPATIPVSSLQSRPYRRSPMAIRRSDRSADSIERALESRIGRAPGLAFRRSSCEGGAGPQPRQRDLDSPRRATAHDLDCGRVDRAEAARAWSRFVDDRRIPKRPASRNDGVRPFGGKSLDRRKKPSCGTPLGCGRG